MEFPEKYETGGYAYMTATASDYGYGKIRLHLRLPGLARSYPANAVTLTHSAQFGGLDNPKLPEPSYGWHLFASDGSDGLEDMNLDRTSRAIKKLQKGLDSCERSSGPAELLETYLSRLIYVSKVMYVYMPDRLDDRRNVPDLDLYMPSRDGLTPIHDRIKVLKGLVMKARP